MKLELKHLAPYLPYGLKAKLSKEGVFNLDSEYRNEYAYSICTITDFTTYSKDLGGSMKVDISKDYRFDFDSLSEIDIILRPLSDLTKEIEHNGEKFIPTNILNDYDNGGVAFECDVNGYGKWYMAFFYADGLDSFSFSDFEIIREKLLEWHFDLFGLIEQNLAIDINTLNK